LTINPLSLGNDQCASCSGDVVDKVTADAYAGYVEAAIQRIQKEIPKVVVNLRKI
jgi:phospholipase B1